MGAQLHRNVVSRRADEALTIPSSAHAMGFRERLKHTIEQGAVLSGASGAMRRRRRGDVLILAYHDIIPQGARPFGDRSLHLPQRRFAEQLDALARTHDIVPLESALSGTTKAGGASVGRRPAAVITFDDAYEGAVTVGIEELERRRLPATIFVAPAYLNGGDFWWDALTEPAKDALSPRLRSWALEDCAGRDADIRARAAQEQQAREFAGPPHARGASEADLISAATVPGITIGSHSWSHPNLSRIDDDALAVELVRPLAWLRERFTNVLPVISYPYGLATERVERAAATAGYAAGLRIDGGWVERGAATNPFAIPRLDVPAGLSTAGFELRAAGFPGR
jgi:peptidoglycan/xylan/chitin deacetylase (PgdA/CDA1 family)